MKTFYYTVSPDINKGINAVTIYSIYNNYPHYQNTLFVEFGDSISDSVKDTLLEIGYEDFDISKL